MKDLIESVATQLGMIRAQRGNEREPCIVIGGKVGYRKSNWLNLDFVILLSAYAKAEMAKRGYAMRTGRSGVYICTYGPGSGEGTMTIRSHHACDHTDPISVAEAELRCIADALQSNPTVCGREAVR